jgi:hypothetical protein
MYLGIDTSSLPTVKLTATIILFAQEIYQNQSMIKILLAELPDFHSIYDTLVSASTQNNDIKKNIEY